MAEAPKNVDAPKLDNPLSYVSQSDWQSLKMTQSEREQLFRKEVEDLSSKNNRLDALKALQTRIGEVLNAARTELVAGEVSAKEDFNNSNVSEGMFRDFTRPEVNTTNFRDAKEYSDFENSWKQRKVTTLEKMEGIVSDKIKEIEEAKRKVAELAAKLKVETAAKAKTPAPDSAPAPAPAPAPATKVEAVDASLEGLKGTRYISESRGLTMRAGFDKNTKELVRGVPVGTEITVTEVQKDEATGRVWGKINYAEQNGWIALTDEGGKGLNVSADKPEAKEGEKKKANDTPSEAPFVERL